MERIYESAWNLRVSRLMSCSTVRWTGNGETKMPPWNLFSRKRRRLYNIPARKTASLEIRELRTVKYSNWLGPGPRIWCKSLSDVNITYGFPSRTPLHLPLPMSTTFLLGKMWAIWTKHDFPLTVRQTWSERNLRLQFKNTFSFLEKI
jgi:hypothetical protein